MQQYTKFLVYVKPNVSGNKDDSCSDLPQYECSVCKDATMTSKMRFKKMTNIIISNIC